MQPDYATAVAASSRVGPRVAPDPRAPRTYDRLYREDYTPLYPRVQPLYRRNREITGDPPA